MDSHLGWDTPSKCCRLARLRYNKMRCLSCCSLNRFKWVKRYYLVPWLMVQILSTMALRWQIRTWSKITPACCPRSIMSGWLWPQGPKNLKFRHFMKGKFVFLWRARLIFLSLYFIWIHMPPFVPRIIICWPHGSFRLIGPPKFTELT